MDEAESKGFVMGILVKVISAYLCGCNRRMEVMFFDS